jgi:predicted SprT family Zn-dependent metalloprotease
MKFKVTKKLLVKTYEYLLECRYFSKLPPSHDIVFKVFKSNKYLGFFEDTPNTIMVSKKCANNSEVLQTMAHEMVHLLLEIKGNTKHYDHDDNFDILANKICKYYGFSQEDF